MSNSLATFLRGKVRRRRKQLLSSKIQGGLRLQNVTNNGFLLIGSSLPWWSNFGPITMQKKSLSNTVHKFAVADCAPVRRHLVFVCNDWAEQLACKLLLYIANISRLNFLSLLLLLGSHGSSLVPFERREIDGEGVVHYIKPVHCILDSSREKAHSHHWRPAASSWKAEKQPHPTIREKPSSLGLATAEAMKNFNRIHHHRGFDHQHFT